MKKWFGIWPTYKERVRLAQAAEPFTPDGAVEVVPGVDAIQASTAHVTKHINTLWVFRHKDLARDIGRDPRDTNVAIVRLVADLRLAQATRRAMVAAWVAGLAAVAAIVVGSVALYQHTTDSPPAPLSSTSQCSIFLHPGGHNQLGGVQCFKIRHP